MMDIDAVITWVDGSDPVLSAKRRSYQSGDEDLRQDVAGPTRYASLGEIFWCVASINRFAPWFRRIYIITDGQDPHLEEFLSQHFPEGHIPVEIVDHRTVFKGYEEYLPVFNSRSIETMMWRIPDLSEHFVMFNDDFLLSAEVTPEDFFLPDGRPVCYARKFSQAWVRLLRALKPKKNGRKNISFKESMLRAAEVVGEKSLILRLEHTPRPLLRSWYESWFAEREDVLRRNISCRFREPSQYNAEEIQYLDLYRMGGCEVRRPFDYLFFLQPKPKKDYVAGKMAKLRAGSYRFVCFNSIDLASEEDRRMIVSWVEETLGL